MIHNPLTLDITTIEPGTYTSGANWDYYEQDHVDEIADSMRAKGWDGPPLVTLPDYRITYSGTHRLRAAADAELPGIPTITLHDLFEACDLDLDQLVDEHDLGYISDRDEIVALLPDNARAAYGLDDIE